MIQIGKNETVSGLRRKAQEQDGIQKVLRSAQGTQGLDSERDRPLTKAEWEAFVKGLSPKLGC